MSKIVLSCVVAYEDVFIEEDFDLEWTFLRHIYQSALNCSVFTLQSRRAANLLSSESFGALSLPPREA